MVYVKCGRKKKDMEPKEIVTFLKINLESKKKDTRPKAIEGFSKKITRIRIKIQKERGL